MFENTFLRYSEINTGHDDENKTTCRLLCLESRLLCLLNIDVKVALRLYCTLQQGFLASSRSLSLSLSLCWFTM